MPSKVLDEYLRKASVEELAALKEAGLKANQAGADLTNAGTSSQTSKPIAERSDVVQAGQELNQAGGKQFEAVNGDPQTPTRQGPLRPYAGEPKFFGEPKSGQEMDGQKMTSQDKAAMEKADRQATAGTESASKPKNAYQEALAAGEKAQPAPSQERQAAPAKEAER